MATFALAPGGRSRLHLVATARDADGCSRRADHAPMAAGAAVDVLRLALDRDPDLLGTLRLRLLAGPLGHDLARTSPAGVASRVAELLATGRLVALECTARPRAAANRVPSAGVPIHIGGSTADFADCPHHRTHVQLAVTDLGTAGELVQRCTGGAELARLTQAVARIAPAAGAGSAPVPERAAALLLAGGLCAVQCPRPKGPTGRSAAAPVAKPKPAPRQPEQRKQELAKTWIEFRVRRSRDRAPVAGARYRLELADGTVRTGAADVEGVIYEKGIEPGSCKITLLDYERDEWRRP